MRRLMTALALAAATPAYGAAQQDPAASADRTGGLRVEALAGYDTDGFEDGALYGVRLGYDHRVARNLLFGIDGEFNDVTTEQEFAFPSQAPLTLDDGPEFYVGARATLIVSPRFRLYGGVGYTRMRDSRFLLADPAQPLGPIIGEQSYRDGYRLSGGGQFNISRQFFLGAEYRVSDYDDRFTLSRDQIVGSIGFRF